MLEIFIYIIAFAIGTLLGSFCTLAVYRIPLKKDITHERSFCVNCNHKLSFIDLIPVLSYIFLKGRCRYCGKKIRIRYFVLEVMFGLSYMLFIMSLHINFMYISFETLFYILFGTLFLVTLFLIAGIDKEYKKIHMSVLTFGVISAIGYMLYLYIVGTNIYRYGIYIGITIIFMLWNNFYTKKTKKDNRILQILSLISFMFIFTNEKIVFSIIVLALASYILLKWINNKKEKKEIPIGFLLCVSYITVTIFSNFIMLGV